MLSWIKKIFARTRTCHPDAAAIPAPQAELSPDPLIVPKGQDAECKPVWSVVANVVLERSHGPGGIEKRSGTKHFAPGAKVYVIAFYWGMGGDSLTVIGRHRKSKRFICIDMRAKDLANWRVEMVYSPYVIRQVHERGELRKVWVQAESKWVKGADTKYALRRAGEIVAQYIREGGKTQPYVTRTPPAE